MDNMSSIENILNSLEESIGILIECMSEPREVPLNFDMFSSIVPNIKKLEGYSNNKLGELGMSLRFAIAHLNKIFDGKKTINSNELDSVLKCLNDIKILKNKVNINIPYNKFFEELKSISRNLNGINSDAFLKENNITKICLVNYENIITRYKNVIDSLNELKSDMKIDDFENLKLDLNINYNALRANLNEMYREILVSNIDIADPLLNNLKSYVNNEKYEPIIRTSMVNKEINNVLKRKEIINNFNMLIESLDRIIDRYKDSKVDKNKINIDVEISRKEVTKDYGIDIPQFIEDNYDEHRASVNHSNSNPQSISYDGKVERFIARFAVLKRKFQNKKSLTKEEVRLYNKLESELDSLKKGKGSFISELKFNSYYNKLNKKIKLSRKNDFKQVSASTKKRK